MKSGSLLERAIRSGQFVVTAEITPPRTPDPLLVQKRTNAYRGYLVAANLTDNQSASVRMSSLSTSKLVLDAGIEPIMQITCRDRNRLAIQSDVIGASALGIRNILCVSGDHQKFGDHPAAKHVFDLDSVSLIDMLRHMRDDCMFQNGDPIRNIQKGKQMAPPIYIGAAANPFGSPRQYRPFLLQKKMLAGADFVQTQPVFDIDQFAEWLDAIRNLGVTDRVAVLAGITPVKSVRALIHMRDNVPGIHIPESVVLRLKSASDPEQAGFELAKETMEQLKQMNGIQGIHIMAIGWEKVVPDLIDAVGIKPDLSGLSTDAAGKENAEEWIR